MKAKFISESGIAGNEKKCVMADDGNYLVLVFESHDQKDEFIRKAGLKSDEEDTEEPNVFFGMFVEGRHIAEKMGIKLSETGLRSPMMDQLSKSSPRCSTSISSPFHSHLQGNCAHEVHKSVKLG